MKTGSKADKNTGSETLATIKSPGAAERLRKTETNAGRDGSVMKAKQLSQGSIKLIKCQDPHILLLLLLFLLLSYYFMRES